jgi:hypothetical protein
MLKWRDFLFGLFLAISSVSAQSPQSSFLVAHSPEQPKTGEPVKVTIKTGAESKSALLQVQVVEPGKYVRRKDAAFEASWREFPMHDDGKEGDEKAGDGIFSAVVPGELQKHRNLVRYRFKIANSKGAYIQFPARTNACPNFAWFIYDGIPPWTGASKPGKTPPLKFSPEFLSTLPVYHLIAQSEDVQKSQWDSGFNRQPFFGTLVYDGRIYDHIQFHNRGQGSTYVAGKNKWGFKFNPGDDFAARDFWGKPYKYKWNGLNLNACASPWAPVNRGMAGMDEAVAYRAYQLAGVPCSDTHWVHFRVIDDAIETSPRSQYEGDLWGLYLAVQEKNGAWLRENSLPDGNIYSPESGPKHTAPGMPTDGSDAASFANACQRSQQESWWRAHLDLPAYYGFQALNRLLANIDLRPDGNHYLYHKPDGHWIVLPHDLDMMFIPKSHQPGFVRQRRCLEAPALRIEYQNRAREILDLFCSDRSAKGGQIGQLVNELARALRPAGQERNWAELDEAMWNWNPRDNVRGQYYMNPCRDSRMGGGWLRTLATPDFAGFCKYIVEFCTDARPVKNYRPNDGNQLGYGYGYLAYESRDDKIPATPTVRFKGEKNVFPVDGLNFAVNPFSSPAGAKFAALQWRVREISAPGIQGFVTGQPFKYEIESGWTSGDLEHDGADLRVPKNVCSSEKTYRVRARYKDDGDRCSHWSQAIEFVAK